MNWALGILYSVHHLDIPSLIDGIDISFDFTELRQMITPNQCGKVNVITLKDFREINSLVTALVKKLN